MILGRGDAYALAIQIIIAPSDSFEGGIPCKKNQYVRVQRSEISVTLRATLCNVNQRAKLTRVLGETVLKSFHPRLSNSDF